MFNYFVYNILKVKSIQALSLIFQHVITSVLFTSLYFICTVVECTTIAIRLRIGNKKIVAHPTDKQAATVHTNEGLGEHSNYIPIQ